MGAKAAFGIILLIIIIAIIAWAAMSADQAQMNKLLDAGCYQVGTSGASSAWNCPPGVEP